MSSERAYRSESNETLRDPLREGGSAVGKSTLAGEIVRRAPGPTQSGPNGVAPDAESQVAGAATSSGSSLPAPLRRQFEGSLGVDLGGVRVHTGESSAAAAGSVSARAFAIGEDIHFAEGQYQPSSTSGQTLLAHEVAHTVQQSGGAARRPQFQLDVSTPGDAFEVEADRAAESMVAGRPAQVSAGGGMARQLIQRDWVRNEGEDIETPRHWRNVLTIDFDPPLDWTTLPPPAAVPADPPPMPIARQPRNYGPGMATKDDEEFADQDRRGWTALNAIAGEVETSYQLMTPQVMAFNHAKDAIGPELPLGPAPHGENWNPVSADANGLDQAANQQTVGHSTKLGDLFKDKDGPTGMVTGISDKAVAAGSTVAVSKAFEAARGQDDLVKTASSHYFDHINIDLKNAGLAVKMAINAQSISQAQKDKDKATGDLSEAQEKKKQAGEFVEKGLGWLFKVGKVLVAPEEAAPELAGELVGEVMGEVKEAGIGAAASKIVGGSYDEEIARANEQIQKANTTIMALGDQNLQAAVTIAIGNWTAALNQVPGKKAAVQAALTARHDAYQKAAELAGASAAKHGGKTGKQDGERIRAAIEAIPRVDTVVGWIHAALDKMIVPRRGDYWAQSQAAYMMKNPGPEFDVKALANASHLLGAYRTRFMALQIEWEAKSTSLNQLMMSFNKAGT